MGVEELQRLHVTERGRGEVPAPPPGDPCGGGPGEPVEDPYPQLGQDPVGQVVREVHLPPGGEGPEQDEPDEHPHGRGRGRPVLDDRRAHGVRGEGDQGDEGRLVDEGGETGAQDGEAVGAEDGEEGAEGAGVGGWGGGGLGGGCGGLPGGGDGRGGIGVLRSCGRCAGGCRHGYGGLLRSADG
ncbi:hypothetical protein EQG64_32910 [Streptomyces sp. S6]|nr:hypothetical protein EQG64_32910 [Streptomyces sp. S6]